MAKHVTREGCGNFCNVLSRVVDVHSFLYIFCLFCMFEMFRINTDF